MVKDIVTGFKHSLERSVSRKGAKGEAGAERGSWLVAGTQRTTTHLVGTSSSSFKSNLIGKTFTGAKGHRVSEEVEVGMGQVVGMTLTSKEAERKGKGILQVRVQGFRVWPLHLLQKHQSAWMTQNGLAFSIHCLPVSGLCIGYQQFS